MNTTQGPKNPMGKRKLMEEIKAEVLSVLPGHDFARVKTATIRVIDHTRNLEFDLYRKKDGTLAVCGIANTSIMDKVWKIADKAFRRTTRKGEKTVSFLMENSPIVWSLFAQILEEGGYIKLYPDMDAHHCSGNRYDHRVENGVFLTISVHRAFHRGAKDAAAQGYDAFIAFVESLGNPELLAHYVNQERRVLYRSETDNQMQQDVILEFFGSPERFNRFCKAVQEKIEGQTEKEIRFDLTF